MAILGNCAVFLLLLSIITQSESNEKVFDTYFNGHCYWTEKVSHHVHFLSGCKIYFTCHRGKFLNFYRCPESTVFNTETLQCDGNGICKDNASLNPTYEAWWRTVVEKIDEVFEVLEKKRTSTSSNTTETTDRDESAAVIPSSIPLAESIKLTDSKKFSIDASNLSGSLSLPAETKSTSDSTTYLDSSYTASNLPRVTGEVQCDANGVCQFDSRGNSGPSYPTSTALAIKPTSVHIVPMQFDTLTWRETESYSSYVTPKPLPFEDRSRIINQLGSYFLQALAPNATRKHDFMRDVIFPLVQDLTKNVTIKTKTNQLLDVVFKSADPILYQILDQKVDEESASSITFTVKELKETWNRTMSQARPIFEEIFGYLWSPVSETVAKNTDALLDSMAQYKTIINVGFLSFTYINLSYKYSFNNSPSPSDQLTSYSLLEVRQDLQSLIKALFDTYVEDFL